MIEQKIDQDRVRKAVREILEAIGDKSRAGRLD